MTASTQPSFEDQGATLVALQPIYSALVREFVIDVAECPIADGFSPSPESVQQAADWFQQVDGQIQVHQLRQFLQTTPLANEVVLRHLLVHHMQKPTKSNSDRDKTDFLLVQYFSLCAPSGLEDADVDLDYVAQVLEPVLGPQEPKLPAWLSSLEAIMQSAARSKRLSELLHSGTLEQGRKLKTQNAARYFEPAAMVAFARFSFMIRRIFFRLMHDDLNAIQDGLRELERRGVATIDCRRAQFSAEEPIGRLRMICQSWKVMFHAEYSSGQPLRMLVDLRAAVDDALQNGARKNPLAKSASASASPGAGTKK
ncbi:MAG: hypothetical protein LAO30_04520 [Acidobacteriia bacterium]|nr:hypothetical protein [Terriglobia bacterium]